MHLCFRSALFATQLILCLGLQAVRAQSPEEPFSEVDGFVKRYCHDCHSGDLSEGDLDFAALTGNLSQQQAFDQWVRVFDRVSQKEMPPSDAEQPSDTARQRLLGRLSQLLRDHERRQEQLSGRTVLRRLNRNEYENTVRDLLRIDVDLRDLLPEDTPLHGFDTVAEGLRFSQLQIEKYLEAAAVAVDAAVVLDEQPNRISKRISLKDESEFRENLDIPDGTIVDSVSGEKHRVIFRETDDAVVLFASGGNIRQFSAPAAGRYRIRLSGYAVDSQEEPVAIQIFAHRWQGRRIIGFFQMPAASPRVVEFETYLGAQELLNVQPHGSDFDNEGRSVWTTGAGAYTGRGVALQWIDVEGPLGAWPPSSITGLVGENGVKPLPENRRSWRDDRRIGYSIEPKDPAAALDQIITRFAERSFRRPLEPNESAAFVRLALDALGAEREFVDALKVGLRAVLVSPQFLLFSEKLGELDGYAVANRLAYFLTSSMPDDGLLEAAEDGSILTRDGLRRHTERLLSSAKAEEFISNFTGQWLDLRRIDATSPDQQLYPEFDPVLQRSMVAESEAFFRELLAHDLDVANLIDSDFLMIDRTMALHYGIEGVESEVFRRVTVPEKVPRGGVLTQAAILKVTANGTVTSPVTRGAWIQSRILGQPPQPPPPNVGSVEPDTRGAVTIRELLAKHRDSSTCAACHRHIDPPGFALESFDVIGGWRDRYRTVGDGDRTEKRLANRDIWEYRLGQSVDASGKTADGESFRNVTEFKRLLLRKRTTVLRALAEHLVVYATGAGIRFSDREAIDEIVQNCVASGSGLRTLIHEIVQSRLFLRK